MSAPTSPTVQRPVLTMVAGAEPYEKRWNLCRFEVDGSSAVPNAFRFLVEVLSRYWPAGSGVYSSRAYPRSWKVL